MINKETFYVFSYTDLPDEVSNELVDFFNGINNDTAYIIYNEPLCPLTNHWLLNEGVPPGEKCLMEVCW